MTSETKAPIRRVMSSNGRIWQTNAEGSTDYLFNPVFMTFYILCVVLYAALMQPSAETSLPLPAQMIMWGGLIMTALIWLALSIWLMVQAFDRGIINAIYTPLALLPLVFVNTFMAEFFLAVFSSDIQVADGTRLENFARNLVALVAFDIMHERFVVPQHPRHVSRLSQTQGARNISAPTSAVKHIEPERNMDNRSLHNDQIPFQEERLNSSSLSNVDSDTDQKLITIKKERIDPCEILFVKCEDHYLNIQMKKRSLLIRGKLRAITQQLGDEFGAQINRSAWVAFSAIRAFGERPNGVLELHLEDDSVHRVANSRRLMIKQDYERFKGKGR